VLEAFAGEPPVSALAFDWLMQLVQLGEPLHAPDLFEYEVANALRGMVWDKRISEQRAHEVVDQIQELGIQLHPLQDGAHRVLEIAVLLGRRSAYDASYLALAEALQTELLTTDRRLYRNARSLGLPVRTLA
jgi:predicted nucleic acid-binding protein